MANFSIVIPTYNERDNIVKLVEEIKKIVPYTSRILIVDDNSPDGTALILQDLNIHNLTVLVRYNERGLGSAIRYGIKKAIELKSDFIVTMDADFSHDPKYLPEMMKIALNENYDLVIGSRYVKGGGIENWPFSRRIISRGANYLFKLVSHSPINDNTSNYRIYSRKAALLALECDTTNGYEFQICSIFKIIRNNLTFKEYPIIFVDRKTGKSKLDFREILNWFLYIVKLSLSS
ncbi:polyprenol monophosphomannose synthase [Saccharolobus islandicus]|uniref:Glycosyl transferase family 2 n=4 Tax=Saccharolobus islandicus TaxID=43080 RepID=F0NC07_SACI5|nr:polyprenol monophosphomannose synthase [Sulfolobus islandicus]ACP38865.1 glycosyl transferase family 2 [Sulfolobus islandicus M.14.25]ACP56069.1 glycosyl transferase family 2 [Sulfolobus islandicus M.16.27]ACR42733.1 glycosyl transferase family 2 [Sulfolobus islandicus M.16.4]ADX86063.1 glycosyl transferase family 2 [Sulfolobus islandicus REY15A]PVU77985.1 polyprenol monophosphomannose synthase [Sulfolobus islandicus]